ncbi:unnamed protein product [Boreogadus saida]
MLLSAGEVVHSNYKPQCTQASTIRWDQPSTSSRTHPSTHVLHPPLHPLSSSTEPEISSQCGVGGRRETLGTSEVLPGPAGHSASWEWKCYVFI